MLSGHRSPRSLYDDWHREIGTFDERESPWVRMFHEHVRAEIELGGEIVLEVGCGRGATAVDLAGRTGAEILAGDFSLAGVALGVEKEKALGEGLSIRWYCASAEGLPFADASIDWLLCFETVEHLASPMRAIMEFARVLRPGGKLVLTTPNYLNAAGLYRAYLRLRGRRFSEAGQPVNRFTTVPRSLWWLWRAGFRVRVFDGLSHFVPTRPGRPALELRALERWRWWTRWIAIQSFFLATRVGTSWQATETRD